MLENELFALLEGTSDAAFAVTEQGEIVAWSKSAQKLFGYSASEALHKTCYEVLEGMGPLGTRVCHPALQRGRVCGRQDRLSNFDMSVKTHSGERRWINMSTLVFDNPRPGGRRLLLHLAHDITEQKKTEDLVRKMLDLSKQLTATGETAVRAAPASPLSEQEKQILRMFAEGKDSDDVARFLDISPQTLRNHLHHINQIAHPQSAGGGNECYPAKTDLIHLSLRSCLAPRVPQRRLRGFIKIFSIYQLEPIRKCM